MGDIYETIVYRGYTIKIVYDNDAEGPRVWDNVGVIYSNCQGYNPDGHTLSELLDNPDYHEEDGNFDQSKFDEDHIWLKVYAYIHGGITIRCTPFGCDWDSGLFGYIVAKKEEAMKMCGFKTWGEEEAKSVESYLRGEIEILNDYYTGSVYGYIVEDGETQLDSCWGFYGDDGLEQIKSDCRDYIDCQIKKGRRDRIEYLRRKLREKGKQLRLPMFVI